MNRILTACAIGLTFVVPAVGQTQDVTQELLDTVRALQQRVTELEAEVAELKGGGETPSDAEDMETRVSRLEDAAAAAPSRDHALDVFWDHGLRMESRDKRFKIQLGGRIHNDYAWFDEDDALRYVWDPDLAGPRYVDLEDGTEFRFARLQVSGKVYDNVEFKAEYDFASGESEIKDLYIGYTGVPAVGKIVVGHHKEPFSLEELVSENDMLFMERGLPNALVPGRNTGVSLHNSLLDNRLTYGVGVFREGDEAGRDRSDGGYNVSARVTGLPWYSDEGARLIHVGASYSHRNPDGEWRYRARPESHLSNWRFLDTGEFYADSIDLYGIELAGIVGPLTLQGESIEAEVETRLRGNVDFGGWYGAAAYVLTGERHSYNTKKGVLGSVVPRRNFALTGDERGWGAWEVALRYSELDLNSASIRGASERNVTAGLNWYLNPNARIMFNYVHADIDHDLYEGDLNIFQTRFQYNF